MFGKKNNVIEKIIDREIDINKKNKPVFNPVEYAQ